MRKPKNYGVTKEVANEYREELVKKFGDSWIVEKMDWFIKNELYMGGKCWAINNGVKKIK